VCFHHNDPDGHTGAAIVLTKYPEAKCVEMDYNKADGFDFDGIVNEGDKVIIIDFSFKPPEMDKLMKIIEDITWIDHHETAFEYPYNKPELPGTRSSEGSGAYLAWKFYYPDKDVPEFVELVSDYDTRTLKFGDKSFQACEGSKLMSLDSEGMEEWQKLFAGEGLDLFLSKGKTCLEYQRKFAQSYAESYGFESELDGHKCFVVNIYAMGDRAVSYKMDDYDMCCSCVFDGDRWTVGLYSTKIDVSKIAQKYKGGGHKGASGFQIDKLPFKKNKEQQ
jgi:oligoribonuclease NrnB/cAMP/cGMP phosphodiesterase (DHH superfamily)